MVSRRQKLARKRMREANPDLFPKPQPPSEKKKKKMKKQSSLNTNRMKKHPLRIPGMRPGESCFICKAADHIAKLCPQKSQWEKNKICLRCRRRGHSLKNCPDKGDAVDKKFCYNCGEGGHSLSKCPLPLQAGGMKFAECFICKEHGHLSRNCPKNTQGVYPKGGSCNVCGEVTHLAKDCPNKGNRSSFYSTGTENTSYNPEKRRGGDDLGDDFMMEETKASKKDVTPVYNAEYAPTGSNSLKKNIKSQKNQGPGPKVVIFRGS